MVAHLPLNALRAFEIAARTGSFSNAAREMGISSAAGSQQVRLLEEIWGLKLFIRQGNRIALTEAGQRWSRKFGPVVKVDRMTRETIRNGKEKDAYA